MPLAPIIIMNAILLAITIILAIADRFLVSYGSCKVTLKKEDEEKKFTLKGGGTLLSALIDNGESIAASCGGRGSCGFCKVQVSKGGGQILPTEELFISKEEQIFGTRLACQVKIKEDIDLFIPDLLTSVKSLVKNGTFDTKLKWHFLRTDRKEQATSPLAKLKIDKKDRLNLEGIIDDHRAMEGALMPLLHAINERYNYLPEEALRIVAKELSIPLSKILSIATFYNAFSLEPRGKNIISVCLGTACHVKGAQDILETFEERLDIKTGDTTKDMLFTLEAVRCIGCCGLAPVITINEEVHGLMTKNKALKLIDTFQGKS